ncbi:MalY/PatB family protein [Bacteroides sp. 51]|uniref:MalY/PatB family protein n=1 Tax=Bacteroides sp. 51 TaxID=2302938 RepID=UPI0013D21112|nr:PatB family C-S lyase [Bacteroides sp. 51]NDV81216.1 putative C-S lyase [Bacteroides sp. 51]
MKYNFDEIIDRRGTDAVKIDAMKNIWGKTDMIPLWVADMDFRTPLFVIDALRERLNHEILGYPVKPQSWYTSIIRWLESRHGWKVSASELTFTPGVVAGLATILHSFTKKGDKVMVQPPVYHPFFLLTEHNHRKVVYNPLILEDGQYRMDMERFKEDIKGCKLFILCNPHNPGGRVWDKDELVEVARICHENGTIVVSDEIHADLTLPPFQHHSFATVSEEAENNSIILMSPSKAFNMPGLFSAYCIIKNKNLHAKLQEHVRANESDQGHVFAYIGVAAAYSNGTEWLDQMLAYVQGNIDYTDDFFKRHMPLIKVIRPQASYLVFLDCRELGLPQDELVRLFVDGAHLALNDGAMFGKEGAGFMRLNVGTPRAVLRQAFLQLHTAYNLL